MGLLKNPPGKSLEVLRNQMIKQGWQLITIPKDTQASPTHNLPALLDQALEFLDNLGLEFEANKKEMKVLKERLANERFHLAVLGQFKRGKSTLLNALIGEDILPTSVVPLTAIPTFLLWGPYIRARVLYQDSHRSEEFSGGQAGALATFLAQFVTEAGNPRNTKGVSRVEVFHPSSLLRKGVVLIDTPGIGSTFRHNTKATLDFLSQCDAALFLVSADPPVTEVEVDFLKEVCSKVTRLFFILNKVDYLSEEEKGALLSFFRKVLREQIGITEDTPIFCISARHGLQARKENNPTLWEASGLKEVQRYLIDFLASDKTKVLQEAVAKKTGNIVADSLMRLQLILRSLKMPLAELDGRLQVFEKKLKEVEQQRILAGDLLAGDKKRTIEFLEEQAENLRRKTRTYLQSIVRASLTKMGNNLGERIAQKDLADAKRIGSFLVRPQHLRWATLQNLNQTFYRFGSLLDERLQATVAATHGAIQVARARHMEHSTNIASEIARLQSLTQALEGIQVKLKTLLVQLKKKGLDYET